MKITGAIFDMDGTILNSMDYWAIVATEFLKSKGIEPPKGTDRVFLEDGMKQWHKKTCPELPYEDVSRGIYDIMDKYYSENVKIKEGAKEMLESLKNHGVKMCLATATDRGAVERILSNLGILDYFSRIFTSKEVGLGKRSPLIYEKALEYLGTDRETTYVFEDAYYAINTCYQNGFKVVGVYDKNAYVGKDEIKAISDYYLDEDSKYKFEIE